jgi:hypothetical protein
MEKCVTCVTRHASRVTRTVLIRSPTDLAFKNSSSALRGVYIVKLSSGAGTSAARILRSLEARARRPLTLAHLSKCAYRLPCYWWFNLHFSCSCNALSETFASIPVAGKSAGRPITPRGAGLACSCIERSALGATCGVALLTRPWRPSKGGVRWVGGRIKLIGQIRPVLSLLGDVSKSLASALCGVACA